jgi:rhamnogalacturonyl hydrolase YesR
MILLMLRLRMNRKLPSKEDQKNNPAPSRAAAMTVRALLNGSDSWVLKRKEQTHVQATEMTSLRGILPCMITHDMKTQNVSLYILSFRQIRGNNDNWTGRTEQMEEDR